MVRASLTQFAQFGGQVYFFNMERKQLQSGNNLGNDKEEILRK